MRNTRTCRRLSKIVLPHFYCTFTLYSFLYLFLLQVQVDQIRKNIQKALRDILILHFCCICTTYIYSTYFCYRYKWMRYARTCRRR